MHRDDDDSLGSPYKLLIETIPHIVWMATADGRTDYLSPWGQQYLGIPEDHAFDWGWLDFVHPDDRETARALWEKAVASRAAYRNEYRVKLAGGNYRYFLSQGVPLLGRGGEVEKWVGTLTDIDELKRAKEDQARDARSLRLRDRAIQAVTQGILITDPAQPDNPIVFASPGFEKMTGYTRSETLGRNCRFLQGRDSDPETVAKVREAIAGRQPCTVEILNYRKDGAPFWNELSIAPVWDESRRLTHFVGVQTDVSERHRLEEQFRQSQKMEAIGRLAGGIAHDFNNLLTVITGYAQLILRSLPESDPLRGAAEQIHRAGERSASLTSQLLAFSRQQVLAPKVLDLNEILRGVQKILRRLIGEDIELSTVLEPGLGTIQADPGQVEQVLLNLAINARDAMPQGGKLTVETRNLDFEPPLCPSDLRPGAYVLLTFSDTGAGMSPEVRKKIFEPFFTTKERGKGTGLGLAVVHGIVRQTGGAIEVYSETGLGTTFKIYLPRGEPAAVKGKTESAAEPEPAGSETILLVEDDEALRGLVGQVLRESGYRVLAAARGDQALELARQTEGPIHVLVTDVVMPGLGGRQVAEAVLKLHPETKVLYLSGYTDDAVIRHGILQEQVSFLQKPFSALALTQKLRQVLSH